MSEEEKLRKAKRRMNRLKKTKESISEEYRYLKDKLENSTMLAHRYTCPVCRQKIDCTSYEKLIPGLKRKIEILDAWFTQNYNYSKIRKIEKPIREAREKQEKLQKQEINDYLTKNRSKLNRAIRTFELPSDITTNREKELWNTAIQLQLDKKGMVENEDLEFEILT